MITTKEYPQGLVINASIEEALDLIKAHHPAPIPLIVTDPPYGKIVKDAWDNEHKTADSYVAWLTSILVSLQSLQQSGDSLYFWGGIGSPKYRPFFSLLASLEDKTAYQIKNLITWSKKRAIGTKYNYLFTREDMAFCIKDTLKPTIFNVPYLADKAVCKGFDPKYPLKSEYKRRTNIWSDVSDMFKKAYKHSCEKPLALYDIPILASSNQGDTILDPFAGSGTAAISAINNNRKFIVVERDKDHYQTIIDRIDALNKGVCH